MVAQIARFDGSAPALLPGVLPHAIACFLDDQPVAPPRRRRERAAENRLRPDMRMTELFAEWKAKLQPRAQTADAFKQSLLDLVEMHGDLPASEVTKDDLLDYRDDAEKLPRSMSKADRALPFSERVGKRIGAIQAFLTFAFKQNWLSTRTGRRGTA